MCGRFTQQFSYGDLHAYFDFFGQPLGNLEPRFSICPTQQITVVLSASDRGHALQRMRWGLVPPWWKKPLKELPATFNARAETVAEKPTFRSAFRTKRCIIPASGTYEWQDTSDGKQPWYFTPATGPVFLIAGLWESWINPVNPKESVQSATMIITDANKFVSKYHDRMPVLLNRTEMNEWLSFGKGLELLKPANESDLKAIPVSRRLNSSRVRDEPDLVSEISLQPKLLE
ncbi:MAG: SOS response-associated peptidase [Micropepsaceae bacterium]